MFFFSISEDSTKLTAEYCINKNVCFPCDTSVCGTEETWSVWSGCSVECGGGTMTRNKCFHWSGNNGGKQCKDETATCNEQGCINWSVWDSWGPCSAECRIRGDDQVPQRKRHRCHTIQVTNTVTELSMDIIAIKQLCDQNSCTVDRCYDEETEDCNTNYCNFYKVNNLTLF